MARTDNYKIQAQQAKALFLTYDQQKLIEKGRLASDERYIYLKMLCQPLRICRATGDMQRCRDGQWVDANSFEEVMTTLDFVCDSRENRYLACRWKNMGAFGAVAHRNLLEMKEDPWALRFEKNADSFRSACICLGGTPLPTGDISYSLELFEGFPVALQLWFGDEEFPPNLRLMWDENALMYIKYETMYFAKGLLLHRIEEAMQ